MFTRFNHEGFKKLIPGIYMKVVGHGKNTITVLFKLEAGHSLPRHNHIYEQTGTLISGKMALTIGETRYDVSKGDAWTIPPDIPHQAEVLEDCMVLEVFSPVREDYLKLAN